MAEIANPLNKLPYVLALSDRVKFEGLEYFGLQLDLLKKIKKLIGPGPMPELYKVVGGHVCDGTAADAIIVTSEGLERQLAYILPILDYFAGVTVFNKTQLERGPEIVIIYSTAKACHDAAALFDQILPDDATMSCFTNVHLEQSGEWTKLVETNTVILTEVNTIKQMGHKYTNLIKRVKFFIVDGYDSLSGERLETVKEMLSLARHNKCKYNKKMQVIIAAESWSKTLHQEMDKWVREGTALPTIIINDYWDAIQFAKLRWKLHHINEAANPAVVHSLFRLILGALSSDGNVIICCDLTAELPTAVMALLKNSNIKYERVPTSDDWTLKGKLSPSGWIFFSTESIANQSDIDGLRTLFSLRNAPGVNPLVHLGWLWNSFPRLNSQATAVEYRELEVNFFFTGNERQFGPLYSFTKVLESSGVNLTTIEEPLKIRGDELLENIETHLPLCNSMKRFGVCHQYDINRCDLRHTFKEQEIRTVPLVPDSGEIELMSSLSSDELEEFKTPPESPEPQPCSSRSALTARLRNMRLPPGYNAGNYSRSSDDE